MCPCRFDGNVTRTAHCEAQYFTNQTRALRAPNSKAAANDKVWLYDAIVAAVEVICCLPKHLLKLLDELNHVKPYERLTQPWNALLQVCD